MVEKFYYHVVTERKMEVGQHIVFDDKNNSGVYRRVMEKLPLVNDIYLNPDKYKNKDLEHHTKVALRELALEEVRKEKYYNYPSRLKSLYVSTNIEDAIMWANVFIKKGRKVFSIVKVKNDGKSFIGDAYNCFDGTIDKKININNADKYWKNFKNETGNEPLYETIIDGNIEVVEIVKEYC